MASSLVVSLVSVFASVALPLQEAINTAHRKEACDPYEHKTVPYEWKALIVSGGAPWYSIFSSVHGFPERRPPLPMVDATAKSRVP